MAEQSHLTTLPDKSKTARFVGARRLGETVASSFPLRYNSRSEEGKMTEEKTRWGFAERSNTSSPGGKHLRGNRPSSPISETLRVVKLDRFHTAEHSDDGVKKLDDRSRKVVELVMSPRRWARLVNLKRSQNMN
jgi:hypothetical protein